MKYTIILTVIISTITSIAAISIEQKVNPIKNVMVIGLDDQAKKALSGAKENYLTALKFNYTNKTEASAKKLNKTRMIYKKMKEKASDTIVNKALALIDQKKAAIIIMDKDTIYADKSARLTIH